MPDLSDFGLSTGDIAFLQKKADAGNLVMVTGKITNPTNQTLATYTPASGKTFVLVKASISLDSNTQSFGSGISLQLRNNTTVKDEIMLNNITVSTAGFTLGIIQSVFIVQGDILVGDGVKVYDIYCNGNPSATTHITGTILGYLE